jgi:hypothetical protein
MKIPIQLLVLVAFVLMLCGCDKPKAKSPAAAGPFQMKGLHLGMATQEVASAVSEKLGPDWRLSLDRAAEGTLFVNSKKLTDQMWGGGLKKKIDTDFTLLLDSRGTVEEINVPSYVTEELFQCRDMSAGDFAKQVTQSYGLPEMKWKGQWWETIFR